MIKHKLLPLYVLVDSEGNFAKKKSGNGGLPVFTSQHTAVVNQRHYEPQYNSFHPKELTIVEYREVTK